MHAPTWHLSPDYFFIFRDYGVKTLYGVVGRVSIVTTCYTSTKLSVIKYCLFWQQNQQFEN